MSGCAELQSDLSDPHPTGRIALKAAENLASSDHPTLSDRNTDDRGKKHGWCPAEWRARLLKTAPSDDKQQVHALRGDVREVDPPPSRAEALDAEEARRALIRFLVRSAGDALAALAGPELGPVLQVGEVDHDGAERAAMAEHYAAPVAQDALAAPACFPCGRPTSWPERTWSSARGWCCPACRGAAAEPARRQQHHPAQPRSVAGRLGVQL